MIIGDISLICIGFDDAGADAGAGADGGAGAGAGVSGAGVGDISLPIAESSLKGFNTAGYASAASAVDVDTGAASPDAAADDSTSSEKLLKSNDV